MPPELIYEMLKYVSDREKLRCYQSHTCFNVLKPSELSIMALATYCTDDTILCKLPPKMLIKMIQLYGEYLQFIKMNLLTCGDCNCPPVIEPMRYYDRKKNKKVVNWLGQSCTCVTGFWYPGPKQFLSNYTFEE